MAAFGPLVAKQAMEAIVLERARTAVVHEPAPAVLGGVDEAVVDGVARVPHERIERIRLERRRALHVERTINLATRPKSNYCKHMYSTSASPYQEWWDARQSWHKSIRRKTERRCVWCAHVQQNEKSINISDEVCRSTRVFYIF